MHKKPSVIFIIVNYSLLTQDKVICYVYLIKIVSGSYKRYSKKYLLTSE